MKLKEFASKYLPHQEGHSEDLEFLEDLNNIMSRVIKNTVHVVESKDYELLEEYEEFYKFKEYIQNNPNHHEH